MVYGKLFKSYMKNYPNAAEPSATRCSNLPYSELRGMAKTMYHTSDMTKDALYKYQNLQKRDLARAVYDALRTL